LLEHGELVAQGQDLDLLRRVRPGAQHHPIQEFGEHQLNHPKRHRRIMPGSRQ
jgi:hypothetical protein